MKTCKKCNSPMLKVTPASTYEVRPPLVDVPEKRKLPGMKQYECPNCDRPELKTTKAKFSFGWMFTKPVFRFESQRRIFERID